MIGAFEYVTVLISIVLGLGITQILTGLAALFQKIEKIKTYWPHLLWVLFVLILQIQEWWVTYELRYHEHWRLPTFLFIMLYPVNLFVIAKMLFPKNIKGKTFDFRKFYLNNYRKIFLLFILSALLSIVYNLSILNLNFESQILQTFLIIIFSIVTFKQFNQQWIHKTLAVLVITILAISIVIEWNVWLIN